MFQNTDGDLGDLIDFQALDFKIIKLGKTRYPECIETMHGGYENMERLISRWKFVIGKQHLHNIIVAKRNVSQFFSIGECGHRTACVDTFD